MVTEGSSNFEPSDKPDGRYINLKPLTAGGMGVVYQAYDTILDKPIAIKTLLFDSKTQGLVARFQQEARLISKLNHPNIVSILDFGLSKEEEPYMVMDFVNGVSLADFVKSKGKLTAREIVDIVSQICRGMSHAHSKAIIHRDLKPGNILIADDAPIGENVRIVDFGIATVNEPDGKEGFRTSGNKILGSPLYMSPEQVESKEVDQRTDIYSLGCLMYKMASGHPPFFCDTAMDTMQAHVHEIPKAIEIESDNSILASNLTQLIMKCLEKNPEDRYQSMVQILDLLESAEFTTGRTVLDIPKESNQTRSSIMPVVGVLVTGVALLALVFYIVNKSTDNSANLESDRKLSQVELKKVSMKKFVKANYRDLYGAQRWIPKNSRDITNDDLLVFKSALKRVRAVGLKETNITDEGLTNLANLKLNLLDLTATKITDNAAQCLRKFDYLYDLSVEDTEFGDRGIEQLDNPLLQSINISNCPNISDKGLTLVTKKWPNLTNINVENLKVSQNALMKVCNLKKLSRIGLNEQTVSSKLVDTLVKNSSVKSITLVRSKISKNDLEKIIAIKSLKSFDAGQTRSDYASWIKSVEKRYPDLDIADIKNRSQKNLPEESEWGNYIEFLGDN